MTNVITFTKPYKRKDVGGSRRMTTELIIHIVGTAIIAFAGFRLGVLCEKDKPRRLRRKEMKQMLGRIGK